MGDRVAERLQRGDGLAGVGGLEPGDSGELDPLDLVAQEVDEALDRPLAVALVEPAGEDPERDDGGRARAVGGQALLGPAQEQLERPLVAGRREPAQGPGLLEAVVGRALGRARDQLRSVNFRLHFLIFPKSCIASDNAHPSISGCIFSHFQNLVSNK